MSSAKPLLGGLAACALLAGPVAAPAAAQSKKTITLSGSTSVAPLVTQLAKAYVKQPKVRGKVGFKVLQGGSDVGVSQSARGQVTFGMVSRDPLPGDPGVTFNKIARDGVCIVTHPSNPLGDLSQAQVQQIFSGRVRSWSDVPGAKVTGTIDLVTRTASSGTADAFRTIFLGQNLNIAANASAKASNGLVRQTVASNRHAIGFVSSDFTQGVSPASYRGVACTLRNAKSGAYTGVRNFWLTSRGRPSGAGAAFLRWVKTNPTARRIVNSDWIAL